MFKKSVPKYQMSLERELEDAIRHLKIHVVGTEEHTATMEFVERLHRLLPEKQPGVSHETMAAIAGNLAGIVMILKHESLNNITSKALGFVIRSRI